jgi:hypothetical protein
MGAKGKVAAYLDLLDAQHREVFALLENVPAEQLWQRPAAGEWSIGEILDHTRILNRSFRRIFKVVWVVLRPLAWLRRHKPYETEIDDVYARPDFPMSVGWLWKPKHDPADLIPLDQLRRETAVEHQKIRAWFEARDEAVLGHVNLYDPVIGWLNMVQALRVAVYHDALHFRDIAQMAAQWRNPDSPISV